MRDGFSRLIFTRRRRVSREAWGRLIGAALGLGGALLFLQDILRALFQ